MADKSGPLLPPRMNTPESLVIKVVTTRLFPVTRARLFEAFSDPEQLVLWWGPHGFTNTIEQFDLRPGGTWKLTMHGPKGADYPNESEFLEVVIPEKVIYLHQHPRYQMEMLFAEEGTSSRLTWHMDFEGGHGSEKMREFLTKANEENFDRLQAHLEGAKV